MGFELVKKKAFGNNSLKLGFEILRVNKATISFGKAIKEFVGNHKYMNIYTDEEKGLLAIKPTHDKGEGFPIRYETGDLGQVSINLQAKSKVKMYQFFKPQIVGEMLVCRNVEYITEEERKAYVDSLVEEKKQRKAKRKNVRNEIEINDLGIEQL